MGNIWWESNVKHLFPVGEVNGTFGVYRPGGSALNSTQVGGLRAAQYINANYAQEPMNAEMFTSKISSQLSDRINIAKSFLSNKGQASNVVEMREAMQQRMTKLGAHIRSLAGAIDGLKQCAQELEKITENTKISSAQDIPYAFMNRDILLTQFVYLNAIKEFIEKGGRSRGSYLVQDDKGELPIEVLPELFRFSLDSGDLLETVCETEIKKTASGFECFNEWNPVRPIPSDDNWFENVWNEYMRGNIIK
jgi:succinate dehydrogenase/fumarate reductase flavoprotein subunit